MASHLTGLLWNNEIIQKKSCLQSGSFFYEFIEYSGGDLCLTVTDLL